MNNRKSERPSTVKKTKELEDKLDKRNKEAEIRKQKSRSKKVSELHQKELNLFTDEARRLSESVDRLYEEYLDPEIKEESLEWDSDEITTTPTFSSENPVNSLSDINVLEITENILNESDEYQEENLVSRRNKAVFGESRRNTSTDIGFLESPTPVENYNSFNWPLRYPSQEPEDLPAFGSLLPVVTEPLLETTDEVFEPATTIMDNPTYDARYKVVKIAARKVKNVKKMFLAENVTSIHVPDLTIKTD